MGRGHSDQLRDTSPISFTWPDGTIQSLSDWGVSREDGDGNIRTCATWETTNPKYPTIYWILGNANWRMELKGLGRLLGLTIIRDVPLPVSFSRCLYKVLLAERAAALLGVLDLLRMVHHDAL